MDWSRDFVVFAAGEWKKNFHRKTLYEKLAERPEVKRLFVIQIPADLLIAPLKKPFRLWDAIKTFWKPEKVGPKIYLYRPFNFVHQLVAFKFYYLNLLNKLAMKWQLRRFFKKEQIDPNALVWIYRPELFAWATFSSDIRVIYDCYDEYTLNANDAPQEKATVLEKKLLEKSSIVFVTARKLLQKARAVNPNSFLVFNGARVDYFSRAVLEQPPKPADLQRISGPIIGYVGLIRDWIDFDLLEQVVKANSQYTFVFVGPQAPNVQAQVQKLKRFQNVYFLGPKPFAEVFKYVHGFDVAIIPNRRTKFNESVVPYKLFEYLAAGKVVVATKTCEDFAIDFKDYVLLADSAESFSQQLSKALTIDEVQKRKNFEFGRLQSWENRVEQMMNILKERNV